MTALTIAAELSQLWRPTKADVAAQKSTRVAKVRAEKKKSQRPKGSREPRRL